MLSIQILDLHADRLVEATLEVNLSLAAISGVDQAWAQDRASLGAQHSHWRWEEKFLDQGDHDLSFIGLSFNDRVQGLLAIETKPVPFQSGPPLAKGCALYVAYLESAPWNLKAFNAAPDFGLIGTALLRYAVAQSKELGCQGQLALLALPQAEPFYEKRGFIYVRYDPAEGLNYYELAEGPANRLFEGGE